MSTRVFILIAVVLCAAWPTAARQNADQYVGVWSGTWEGSGSGGGFELTIDTPKDGQMTGHVSVTGEPEYKADLKSLAFTGAKMTAKYDFTPDPSMEVVVTGTFDGKNVAGAWSVRAQGSSDEVAAGTWKASKK